jgi:CDP-paratose 2-epimerase
VTPRDPRRVLVTGGAGFVGASLSLALAGRHADWEVVALDNLRRRGSELNLPRLRDAGVEFVHGDVREPSDLLGLGRFDALIECSAEPSALAGLEGDTAYVVDSNLTGAHNCLELARRDDAQFVFLSTSRVYPFGALDALAFREEDTRFELEPEQAVPGAGAAGVAEDFPLTGPRTLYGATKLAVELLVTEYASAYGLRTVVDRCGVIAGPWQMGKVDQGVFTYWALAHYRGDDLSYIGYGGRGKQVRDLLHVDDLADLIDQQLADPDHWAGMVVNVGGGREHSLSLMEATEICAELTGRSVAVRSSDEQRHGDVRIYLSDCARLNAHTDWRPARSPRRALADIVAWIEAHERTVLGALG